MTSTGITSVPRSDDNAMAVQKRMIEARHSFPVPPNGL
jgi:hypothetical protein